MAAVATCVVFEEQVEVPLAVRSLDDFRRWALSDEFPQTGRIDYIAGRIEVDTAPEDLFCHGTLKSEIASVLQHQVKLGRLGHLLIDSTRVSSPAGDLSAEPDIVFISRECWRPAGLGWFQRRATSRGAMWKSRGRRIWLSRSSATPR